MAPRILTVDGGRREAAGPPAGGGGAVPAYEAARAGLLARLTRFADQKTITSRPRVPPAANLRCASAARSGGKVSATRRVSLPLATR